MQAPLLIGPRGLYPAHLYLERLRAYHLHNLEQPDAIISLPPPHGQLHVARSLPEAALLSTHVPTVFWLDVSDHALLTAAGLGLALALLLVTGACLNAAVLALLWLLSMSFTQVGQVFYGYGWESQLLETAFLAMMFAPLSSRATTFTRHNAPSWVFVSLLCLLEARIMLGAGLIKLRSRDDCWRELTCLDYHYETQPIPNPVSWYLHQLPKAFHHASVLVNHFVELVVPFLALLPFRRTRAWCGACFIGFQLVLILSGNLSFLNWLTIAPCILYFDDHFWQWCFSADTVRRAERAARATEASDPISTVTRWWASCRKHWARRKRKRRNSDPTPSRSPPALSIYSHVSTLFRWSVAALLCYLLRDPLMNLAAEHQLMNASFDRFKLVNTYGAFGTVGKERREIVIQGTTDDLSNARSQYDYDSANWEEYEFKCKPGALDRRPCVLAPYHLRIDWQAWFAAMQELNHNPWLVHLTYKLLHNDEVALQLLDRDALPSFVKDGVRPRYIRIMHYIYKFTDDWTGKAYWKRERLGHYLPPIAKDNVNVIKFIESHGWPVLE